MTVTVSYPPHPAEGRPYSPLDLPEAGTVTGSRAPAASVPTEALPVVVVPTAGPASADHHPHWLASDPSSRSPYPVD